MVTYSTKPYRRYRRVLWVIRRTLYYSNFLAFMSALKELGQAQAVAQTSNAVIDLQGTGILGSHVGATTRYCLQSDDIFIADGMCARNGPLARQGFAM